MQIHIAGSGKEINLLNELINQNELSDIIVKYGFINHDQLNEFFSNIDLFIFPSRRKGESLGLVALEALASGTPVIANINGAVEDFISNGGNGFLYSNDDPRDLEKMVIKFVKLSKSEKEKLSRNARESVQNYDSAIISKKMADFLKSTYNQQNMD